MAPRPPNYANDRSQRERAQRQKAEEKALKRAEKSAKRKAVDGEPAPDGKKDES
jgi:hypothetical protein